LFLDGAAWREWPRLIFHPRFQASAVVLAGDIDEMDHVNNAVYLRWVQAAAVAHWRAAASEAMQATTQWVVLRHEIDYKVPALAGDELLIETWVGAATRITFERHTEIFRANNRQLLAKARTLWCPIDAQTRRPTRVDPAIRAQFSVADDGGPEK
jgi:acyl-CoA thioester hydrolase